MMFSPELADGLTCGDCMSREVITIDPHRPLLEAARLMREMGVGAIPVCPSTTAPARLLGMVTDRDIVVRVIAEDLDLERVDVGEIMTTPVIYCFEDESPWTALHLMEQHLIRRLPVLDRKSESLRGILTITDLSRLNLSGGQWRDRVVEVLASQRKWDAFK